LPSKSRKTLTSLSWHSITFTIQHFYAEQVVVLFLALGIVYYFIRSEQKSF